MSRQSHQSDPRILNQRTLERDHRLLAPLLRPGLSVLDVGCGTGAITAGIAARVAPGGRVVGMDRDESLLEIARQQHPTVQFLRADVTQLEIEAQFDIVTAARTIQWVNDPAEAARRMVRAAKPGGHVVILDYNHAETHWQPAPPSAFAAFYEAFLNWRTSHRWSNHMADELPNLLKAAGAEHTELHDSTEQADNAALWVGVMDHVGPQMRAEGFDYPQGAAQAAAAIQHQWLAMKTAIAVIPPTRAANQIQD